MPMVRIIINMFANLENSFQCMHGECSNTTQLTNIRLGKVVMFDVGAR